MTRLTNNLFIKIIQIFIIPLVFQISNTLSYTICPNPCDQNSCPHGTLSCSKVGLNSIPINLPSNIKKIIIGNQYFHNPILSYSNLSSDSLTGKLTHLQITNSGLTEIKKDCFTHLYKLNHIDLTNNNLKLIKPFTFQASLNKLILDGNKQIQFTCRSFEKSVINHLSLRNCSLTHIDYCILKPINGKLKELFLSNNKLRVLDSKFSTVISRLIKIDLTDNLFDCSNCRLNWLTTTLKKRYKNIDGFESYPAECHTPKKSIKKYIKDLPTNDFVCHNPVIKSINLKFNSINKLILICYAETKYDDVLWLPNHYMSEKGKSEITLNRNQYNSNNDLSCLVSNSNGNVSAKIKITWPQIRDKITNYGDYPNGNNENRHRNNNNNNGKSENNTNNGYNNKESRNKDNKNFLYTQQFSLMELLAAIFGSFILFIIIFTIGIKYLMFKDQNRCGENQNIYFSTDYKKANSNYYEITNGNNSNNLLNNHLVNQTLAFNEWELLKCNNNSNQNQNQIYDTPTLPKSIFLDYKTQKRIHT